MVSLKYIGDREELKGSWAILQAWNQGFVKAQFTTVGDRKDHFLCYGWHDFQEKDFMGPFEIRHALNKFREIYYRVWVKLPDGKWDESQLYTWDEAIQIVGLGLDGELKGSFAIGVPAWPS